MISIELSVDTMDVSEMDYGMKRVAMKLRKLNMM